MTKKITWALAVAVAHGVTGVLLARALKDIKEH
jgi:hypothetical protein